jgi:hypothetical protein
MARSVIILMSAILTMGASCQTQNQRLDAAATTIGETRAALPRPATPESCTARIGRVVPKVGEKARWVIKRWEVVAENRNRLAENCEADMDEYWNAVARIGVQ